MSLPKKGGFRVPKADSYDVLSLDDLTLSDVEIEDLQNENTLGIPELGASASVYSCCTFCSL